MFAGETYYNEDMFAGETYYNEDMFAGETYYNKDMFAGETRRDVPLVSWNQPTCFWYETCPVHVKLSTCS
jgi:hypothetical protein